MDAAPVVEEDQYARLYQRAAGGQLTMPQKVYNTLVDMMRDREYDVSADSAYDPAKGSEDWVLKGYHQTRQVGNEREKIFVFMLDEAFEMRRLQELVEGYKQCRMLLVFFGRLPAARYVEMCRQQRHKARLLVELFEARRLVYNVTKHFLVPKHVVLTEDQKAAVLRELRVREHELQTISLDDPVAKHFGLVEGQVVMIVRVSENSGKFVNYRICVDK